MSYDQDDLHEASTVTISYCRRCAGHRNHIRIATESETDTETLNETGILFKTTFDLLRCQGCDALSVRRDDFCDSPAIVYAAEGWGESRDDSNGRHQIDYWPSVEKRVPPKWLWELEKSALKETLLETYNAFNENMQILEAAGTRIVFDLLTYKLLGRDAGTFGQKLDALFSEGHISERQKRTLQAVVDAGSAAQHRAHKAAHDDLKLILDVLESLIHQTVLADAKVDSLRDRTPQRKKK